MLPQWWIPEPSQHHDSQNSHRMVYMLRELGATVYCEKYMPFGAMDYSFIDRNRPIVLYGHIAVIKDVKRRNIKGLRPFAWCDFDELTCSNYLAFWGKHSLHQDYAFYPLREIQRQKDFIFKTFGKYGIIFIRPDDNMKTFTGDLISQKRFDGWSDYCIDYQAGPNCLCLVSKPVSIDKEWRFIIHDKKVIAGSQYKELGYLHIDASFSDIAAAKAEEIARSSLWEPAPIYVMDIGLSHGEYKLIEIGSVNAAGFYACDLRKIVNTINKFCEENYG
jgi:hypothetical protein